MLFVNSHSTSHGRYPSLLGCGASADRLSGRAVMLGTGRRFGRVANRVWCVSAVKLLSAPLEQRPAARDSLSPHLNHCMCRRGQFEFICSLFFFWVNPRILYSCTWFNLPSSRPNPWLLLLFVLYVICHYVTCRCVPGPGAQTQAVHDRCAVRTQI